VAQADGFLVSQTPLFFGWKVAWAAFIVAVFSWGVGFYGPAVFLQALHAAHGWPIWIVSTAITAHFLLSAVVIGYLPRLHRRLGIAVVTKAGMVLSAIGIVAWANAQVPWQLFPAAGLTGAGWAVTSGAAINAMVARWFNRERPKALSLAFNGASIGGVVFAPLWTMLIARFGFSHAASIIAVTMLVVTWPLASQFLRPRPDALGVSPDGEVPVSGPQPAAAPTLTRGRLLHDGRFVTISVAFALALFAQIGLFAHLIARLAPDFGATGAAVAVSLTTACAVAGRTLLGWFLGDHDRRKVAAVNFALQAAGVTLLCLGSGFVAPLAGCVLFGLGVGNLISLPPLIAQQEFEPAAVGTVVVLITALNQAVFAFAPAIFGVLKEMTDGYAVPFAIAACLQILAAIAIMSCRRPSVA
jgi:MFS family permease